MVLVIIGLLFVSMFAPFLMLDRMSKIMEQLRDQNDILIQTTRLEGREHGTNASSGFKDQVSRKGR